MNCVLLSAMMFLSPFFSSLLLYMINKFSFGNCSLDVTWYHVLEWVSKNPSQAKWLHEGLTRAWKKWWWEIHLSIFLFLFFSIQTSLGVTMFLSSTEQSMASLLCQIHKVRLFRCCTSITHGNRIGFVSAAATSVNRSETSGVKGKGFSKQTWRFSELNHWACPSP